MFATLPQRLLAHLPRGRHVAATVAAIALAGTAALVITPSAASAATTPLTVTVAGASLYGSAPGFGATTNVSGVTVTGVTCSTTTTNAALSPSLAAGNYTIKASSCSGGVLSDPSYSIGSYNASFYTVYKVGITVTADNKSRAYGVANPAFSYTATGWANGDTSALLAGVPAYSTTATPASDIGSYPISIAQNTLHSTSANYYFAAFNPGTLTVGAIPLTVTVAGAQNYGSAPGFGQTTSVSGVTVTGVSCTTTTSGSTISSTLNAGSYTIDGTTCSGGTLSDPHYSIGAYKASFYLVYKDEITVTADDQARAYGHANPALTYQLSGFVNGEDASVLTGKPSLTTTATLTSDTGTYPITPALNTLRAANYYFTLVPGTLTIGTAAVTVTVAGAQNYGSAPGFGQTTSVSGVTVTGVTCTTTTSGLTISSALNAGSYTIDGTTCSGGTLSNPDYSIAAYKASFYLVYKDPLTVTANDVNRAYGHANPALTYQLSGFVNGEDASVVTGKPSITTTATATSDAGAYPITAAAGTLAAANYYLTFVPGTLTVNQVQVAVTVAGAQNYGTAPGFGGTTTVSGLTVTGITCTGTTSSASITSALAAGGYTIDGSTCSGGVLSSTNYAIRGYAGSFYLVYKAPLTVTPTSTSRTYGAANPAFAYVATGFVSGDTATAVTGAPALTTTATDSSGVGTYPINGAVGTLTAANYYFTFPTTSTLTVTPATLTVTALSASRAYGDPTPAFGYSITGYANGDTSSVVTGTPGSTSTATATSDPGTYVLTPTAGTLAAANYTFAFVPGTLTVVKATPVFATSAALTQPMKDTVTYGANSTPLVGVTINFYLGKTTTLECSAVTDNTGLASCKAPGLQGAQILLQGYTASFAGNIDFNALSKLQH